MRIEHLHTSISQLSWDASLLLIREMRNRRRTPINPPKTKKAAAAKKAKKQPKQLDLFAVANTMKQKQKDVLLEQLMSMMEDE